MSQRWETPADTRDYIQTLLGDQFNDSHWIRQALAAPPGCTDRNNLLGIGRAVVELIALVDLQGLPIDILASDPELDRSKMVEAIGKKLGDSDVPKYAARDGDYPVSDLGKVDLENFGMCILAAAYLDSEKSVPRVEACLRALSIGELPSLRVLW